MIKIRASMLPSYHDCPRRAASKSWKRIIEERGYIINNTRPSIGAAVGTGVHAAQSHALILKRDKGDPGNAADGIEIAINSLREETVQGAEFDNTTASKNDAEKQIQQLTVSLYEQVIPIINPKLVEHKRPATIAEGFQLIGTLDVETTDDDIGDTKTGAMMRPYEAQFGAYSLLKKSHDGKSARIVFVDHLPRTSVKKTYPGSKRYFYDVTHCEQMAFPIINHIIRDVSNFLRTGNPWSFPANPMSSMCSRKYCPAFNTEFCNLKKDKE